jgi:hypothetical protein
MEYSYDTNIIQNGLPIFNITLFNNNHSNIQFIGWNLPLGSKINYFIGIFYEKKIYYREDLYALELASNHKIKNIDSNNDLKSQGISSDFYVDNDNDNDNDNISPPSKKRKSVLN